MKPEQSTCTEQRKVCSESSGICGVRLFSDTLGRSLQSTAKLMNLMYASSILTANINAMSSNCIVTDCKLLCFSKFSRKHVVHLLE